MIAILICNLFHKQPQLNYSIYPPKINNTNLYPNIRTQPIEQCPISSYKQCSNNYNSYHSLQNMIREN